MRSKKPLVYVCGPYSAEDAVTNTRDACHVGNAIQGVGGTPIVPHLSLFWQAISPKPYQSWLDYDFELLSHCDALVRFDNGRPSPGADREVEWAIENGLPVFDTRVGPVGDSTWAQFCQWAWEFAK